MKVVFFFCYFCFVFVLFFCGGFRRWAEGGILSKQKVQKTKFDSKYNRRPNVQK